MALPDRKAQPADRKALAKAIEDLLVASGAEAGPSSSAIDPARPSSGPPRRRRPPRRPRRRGLRSPFAG